MFLMRNPSLPHSREGEKMSKITDKTRVLEYLRANGSVTPLEALNSFGCYRLGARIFDLRQEGYRIKTTMIQETDRHGEPMRYARYFLVGEPEASQ